MRRMAWILLLAFVPTASAQDDLTVLKATEADDGPRTMLANHLQVQARRHFDARRHAVAALKTPADVAQRQKAMKARFLQAIGSLPELTPLNPQVVGTIQRDGYRIERVIYESRPNHHVTALLYLPNLNVAVPGILFPCGHSNNGKAAEAYQRACSLFAKNGMAVLCYDPIGQGERVQLLNEQGKPALGYGVGEHIMVGVGALLIGQNTATYRIWDGIRSLDYLASRVEVDAKRLGCTGNSGGGTMTSYLMALDDRIVAAAPSCYITSMERLFATIGPQDSEQNITGQVAFGMEHADYLTMRAPRPTLICTASRDFFDITGAWTTFREAKKIYGLMDFSERVDLCEYNKTHGFSKQHRQSVLRFMRRWLLNKDDAPVEEDSAILEDAKLQCTRTGQVLLDYKGKSVFMLNAERETKLALERAEFQKRHSREETLEAVRSRIGLTKMIDEAKLKDLGKTRRNETVIRKLVFETEPLVQVPGLLLSGKDSKGKQPLLIYLHSGGKAVEVKNGGLDHYLSKSRVLVLDLRGLGETAPASARTDRPNYFGADFKEAYMSIDMNRPLLGQRVYDVLSIVRTMAKDTDTKSDALTIMGVDTCGPIALHAAAFDTSIQGVRCLRSLLSWSAVVRTPISVNQLTNAVPGALEIYDLPDLAAWIAPRPLEIEEPVDPAGNPVTHEMLVEAYAGCRDAYEKSNASKSLILHTKK